MGHMLEGLDCLLLCSSATSSHGDHGLASGSFSAWRRKAVCTWQTLGIIAIMDRVGCIHTFGAGES